MCWPTRPALAASLFGRPSVPLGAGGAEPYMQAGAGELVDQEGQRTEDQGGAGHGELGSGGVPRIA